MVFRLWSWSVVPCLVVSWLTVSLWFVCLRLYCTPVSVSTVLLVKTLCAGRLRPLEKGDFYLMMNWLLGRPLDFGSSVIICFLIWFSPLSVPPRSCLLFPSWHCAGVALSSSCQHVCWLTDWTHIIILSPGSLCLVPSISETCTWYLVLTDFSCIYLFVYLFI